MKTILAVFLTIASGLVFLHSGLSSWRIVSQESLDATGKQIADLTDALNAAQQRPLAGSTPHPGAWMWDANYRTALEKGTVSGKPHTPGQ